MYRKATTGSGGPENFHGASCITGIDLHITLVCRLRSKEPLQLGSGWRGKGRPQGVVGLREEKFTITVRIGAHY
jgi:hypothetical protein